jgi:EF hand
LRLGTELGRILINRRGISKYLIMLEGTSMKLTPCAALTVLLGAGAAFAGGGAPVPETPQGGPPSGRPGAILDEKKCKAVWSLTEREGITLTTAAPFMVNFQMVDTNKDGKVTLDEFMEGCKKGLVQEHASKPGEIGGGQTPEQPTKQ